MFNFSSWYARCSLQSLNTAEQCWSFICVTLFQKFFLSWCRFPIFHFSSPSFLTLKNLNRYRAYRTIQCRLRLSLFLWFFPWWLFFLVLSRLVYFELDDGLLLSGVFVLPEVDGNLVGILVLRWAYSLIFDWNRVFGILVNNRRIKFESG